MKFSLDELGLIRWALLVGIEWEEESIRCQQESWKPHKDLPGYEEYNAESARRIERCRSLLKRLANSIKRRT